MDAQQNTALEIWEALKKCKKIAISLHKSPDGDSLGSSTAMKYALEKNLQISICLISPDPLPVYLKDLDIAQEVKENQEICSLNLANFDAIICLDSAGTSMITKHESWRAALAKEAVIVNIDHHATNTLYGDLNLVDSTKSSCAEVLTEFFKKINLEFDKELAKRLLIGICADTECFRFVSKDSAGLFKTAAFLINSGVDFTKDIINPLFFNQPLEYKKFQGLILKNLKTPAGKNFAYSTVSKEEWKTLGLEEKDLVGSANLISDIRQVGLIFTLVEQNNEITGSLRSRKGVDVSEIAQKLGGGGHKSAAGFRLTKMPLQEAEKKVISIIENHAPQYG